MGEYLGLRDLDVTRTGVPRDMTGMLRAIETRDLVAVSEFLLRVHHLGPVKPFAETRTLEWKYLVPRSDWQGSRGFVLEKSGRIVAFGGVVPAELCLPSGETVESGTVIDWAADPSVPRAGVVLMNQLLEKMGSGFVIGGAAPARALLPRIGFRPAAPALAYARWVRPWREFQIRPKSWRSVLRLSHGLVYSLRPRPSFRKDWESVALEQFDSSLQALLDRRSSRLTFCRRTVEHLNYMLQCPAVEMKGFLLRRNKLVAGYFILAEADWEGRIVDIFVDSGRLEDWKAAYAIATHAMMRSPGVCRISAWTAPPFSEALLQNGFWLQDKVPILIRDSRNLLARAFPVNLQLFEGDNAYLTG